MGDIPHDRSHLLWEGGIENGTATLLFKKSMDGWINAMVSDEQGGGEGPEIISKGYVVCKEGGIFCGKPIVNRLIKLYFSECRVIWNVTEGSEIRKGQIILEIIGISKEILKIERILLNILGNMSGISTNTRKWVERLPNVKIAATRKTDWGLMDKWAVNVGGGYTHRLNRGDALMIKENDFAASKKKGELYIDTIGRVINEIDDLKIHDFIVVEVQNLNEAMIVAESWVKKINISKKISKIVLLLDNISIDTVKQISKALVKENLRKYCILEASGGINIDSLEYWADTDIEVISSSKLNRGVPPLDLSMLLDRESA
ncbi:MAG: hypothetical protein CND89_02075 [Marine Group II euryarchaeote MED-G38]|nr:hypothetical protein [Euryarchaeota archaeon]PDH23194.1 MAG: hypothetical protein CND89_02075 [Marine Group II euryarchaeote MED-G38]|tara:strand:- start:75106 stop:76056 length:951 start_codon:yes stop_codon:yes gene_type:complete